MLKKYTLLFFLGVGLFLFANETKASEGIIEIVSTTEDPYRCWASSVKMQNQEFRIPFTCRNLIYPANDSVFNYIVWATPQNGGDTIKLGALGLGRGQFITKKTFTSIFVTTENTKDVKTPQGQVVMKGQVESIEPFFQEVFTPTPTSEAEEKEDKISQEETPTKELTTRQKFLLALKRAGIAALVALVALIGLIFVVTRSRG